MKAISFGAAVHNTDGWKEADPAVKRMKEAYDHKVLPEIQRAFPGAAPTVVFRPGTNGMDDLMYVDVFDASVKAKAVADGSYVQDPGRVPPFKTIALDTWPKVFSQLDVPSRLVARVQQALEDLARG